MSWGFEAGRVYHRRNDIHARFGGQQQGGIITPKDHPLVIIVTGEEGLEHGYADRLRPDGVFEYFGEGQVGDMQLTGGNKAVAEHSASGESLLLFRKAATGLRFEGEMVCETFHYEPSPDREGNNRRYPRIRSTFIRAGQDYRSSATIRCIVVLRGSRYCDDEMSNRQCPACRW